MGNEVITTSLNQAAMVVSIPDVEVTLDKMAALLINDVPDNLGLRDSIELHGPVVAIASYIEGKYGNRQMVSAVVQMQLVEYGTFELDMNRAKRHLIELYGLDGEQFEEVLTGVQERLVRFFPEFKKKEA